MKNKAIIYFSSIVHLSSLWITIVKKNVILLKHKESVKLPEKKYRKALYTEMKIRCCLSSEIVPSYEIATKEH